MPVPERDELRGRRRDDSAYERGMRDGEVKERLRGHDEHLRHIDGSIERMEASLRGLTDEIRADRAARGATQVALEEQQARIARKLEQDHIRGQIRLTFWSKVGIGVMGFAAIGGLLLSALTAAHVI